jgi:CheY-like chemotaxis protein
MSTTILVVDDDEDIREVMSAALEQLGYRVISAADGLECLEALRRERPGLILLDLMMPRMDGWAVCGALAADPALSTIPVVALTGDMRATAEGLAVQALLRKPFDLATLITYVERYCTPE